MIKNYVAKRGFIYRAEFSALAPTVTQSGIINLDNDSDFLATAIMCRYITDTDIGVAPAALSTEAIPVLFTLTDNQSANQYVQGDALGTVGPVFLQSIILGGAGYPLRSNIPSTLAPAIMLCANTSLSIDVTTYSTTTLNKLSFMLIGTKYFIR